MRSLGRWAAALALAGTAAACGATTWSGSLGAPDNPALAGPDLGAPDFSSDATIANNVALYHFELATGGAVGLVSTGFAAGGLDPYFSLFAGSGATAGFVDSNFAQAFSSGGDFRYSAVLAAGRYTVAITSFANLSFAENLGTGTLGDGFTGLGDPGALRDGRYSITLTTAVPEPGSAALLLLGAAALAARRTRSSSHPET